MNYYEVLYILNPNFSKEQIAGVMSEVSSFVEKKKHGIVNHDFWGKKQLAYNVKKHKYGNFVLLNTEFKDANFVNEFKVFLNLNKEPNADINYIGAGDVARSGKKGWYTKLLETISPI